MFGPGGGAPEAQMLYTLNYRQMCLFLYLICDTGRSRIGVGVQGAEPPEAQSFIH